MKSFALLCVVVLSACGGGDDGPTPQQSCLDAADAFGDLCVRCGACTYAEGHAAIVQAANGDCANTISIRDSDELYAQCIPWMMSVSCDAVLSSSFALDLSCQGQLEHR
jgi:hypothetical protein